MSIQRLDPGTRFSQATIHNGIVYLAGQVAYDAPGASVGEQTASALRRIDALLADAGTNKSRLLSVTIWLADMKAYAEMNTVWDAWVSPGNTPARACVESRLAALDYAVEIAVVAAR